MMSPTSETCSVLISHIGDFKQPVPPDVLLVDTDHDYAKVCQALSRCVVDGTGLEVWVRKESHYQWLRQFSEETGIQASFQRQTPGTLLGNAWRVSVPEWLSDEDVLSQELLEMSPPKYGTGAFHQLLLAACLGAPLLASKLTEEKLCSIVESVAAPEAKEAFISKPALRRCLSDQAQIWADKADESWSQWVARRLAEDADGLWLDLTLWALLGKYPEKLLEYTVPPDRLEFLRDVPLGSLSKLSLHPVGVEQAWTQIKMYFRDVKPQIKDNKSFEQLLKRISGRLRQEFHELKRLLSDGTFASDGNTAALLKKLFRGCPGVTSTMLDSVNRFVEPAKPRMIAAGGYPDATRWIGWTVNEYTRYRHWQSLNKKHDSELEEQIRSFSEWYINQYETIHQNGALSLTHTLTSWAELIATDSLSVILMVDCLPVVFWPILEAALSGAGLHRHELTYRYAPLPTDTAHCKPGIIAGHWGESNKGYEELLSERVASDWTGKTERYAPNIRAVSELRSVAHDTVILVNVVPSDQLLHTDVETTGSTHAEELNRLFRRLAEAVSALIASSPIASSKIGIYVLTDHGATSILEEEMSTLESQAVASLFPDPRHRYASIAQDSAGNVPENLWNLGHTFNPPFGSGGTIYFIPAGHNTIGSRAAGLRFAHGGATPEEVIVPTARFRMAPQLLPEPSWRLVDLRPEKDGKVQFYVCRTVRLQIELQNKAYQPLSVTDAEVAAPDTDVKSWSSATIPAGGAGVIVYDLYFSRSAVAADFLTLNLTYELGPQERVLQVRLPATFRSAQTGGFSLRDL